MRARSASGARPSRKSTWYLPKPRRQILPNIRFGHSESEKHGHDRFKTVLASTVVSVESDEAVAGLTPGIGEHALREIEAAIVGCCRCPRLVCWREQAAAKAPRAFADDAYWSRPVAGFGDPGARIYILGLATAAHGGNRTGRAFTGNASADWVVTALHRAGLANQATSTRRGDGLALHRVWMGSAVRCAPPQNRPTATERATCLPYLDAELTALADLRVVLALGQFAWRCATELLTDRPVPKFAHAAEHRATSGQVLLASYHPSRQNTNTRRLTRSMLDEVVDRAKQLADVGRE